MAEPNYETLAALVLAQDATFHTRSAPVSEQIKNYVWQLYHPTVASGDIGPIGAADTNTPIVTDVAGLGASIYAAFVAAGVTAAVGGVAYALEKVFDIVLTNPFTRGGTVYADNIDRQGF